MKQKEVNAMINNMRTIQLYQRQMLALAKSVIIFEDLPTTIDEDYLNAKLVRNGAIAFFNDEVVGLLALPFTSSGKYDVYGRPTTITVNGLNGYQRTLHNGEFVIMYDNVSHYSLYTDIIQYSVRIAERVRTEDLNIAHLKTNRIFSCPKNKLDSLKQALNEIDANVDAIITHENFNISELSVNLDTAPFIANDIEENKEKVWNEFLRLIGIASNNFQKKERNIKSEINASQGGTLASRTTRFLPRQKALNEIKEKWGYDIKMKFYDGMPNSYTFDDADEMNKDDDAEGGDYDEFI